MARNVETLCLTDVNQSMTLDFFLPSSQYQIERTSQEALAYWKTDYSNECFDFYLVSSFPSVILEGFFKLHSAGDLSDVDLKVTWSQNLFPRWQRDIFVDDLQAFGGSPEGSEVEVSEFNFYMEANISSSVSLSNFLRWQTSLLCWIINFIW